MGYKNRAEAETEACLNEALLFATMCIIGLPVDVHIRDGSVYSGTFHTASFDKENGIVLKSARLTKKGKSGANVANGSVIETLVILSVDIVQVVAKGVLFPADGVTGNISGDNVEAAVTHAPSSEIVPSEAKKSNKFTVDKKKSNQNWYCLVLDLGCKYWGSAKNKNGSSHGLMLTKVGKDHEGRKTLPNDIGNAMEFEHGKRDGINVSKGKILSRQLADALIADLFCKVKVNVPDFEGKVDPGLLNDWIRSMEIFFNWYNVGWKKSKKFEELRIRGQIVEGSDQGVAGFMAGLRLCKEGIAWEGSLECRACMSNSNRCGRVLKREASSGDSVNGRVANWQTREDWLQGEQDHYKRKFEFQREKSVDEFHSPEAITGPRLSEAKPVAEGQVTVKLFPNDVSSNTAGELMKPDNQYCGRPASVGTTSPSAVCASVSTTSNPMVDVPSESHCSSLANSTHVVSPQISESNRTSKAFKLNPGAKVFSPSFSNPISATAPAVPIVASMAYMPSNSPAVPVAAVQPEAGIAFAPRSSVPSKFPPTIT
ncbi:unnamed protein product [Dovyalis caffra]|uniref:Ataxin 2 SM domain-containing protein n=1 Tax=Dovyalis caffra TaxID=77055 RepID=A0AAV1RQA5_9ROSI|nr:unnamed protein product [Dovyalis caffra]